jgi:hypothetical protein
MVYSYIQKQRNNICYRALNLMKLNIVFKTNNFWNTTYKRENTTNTQGISILPAVYINH